MVIEGFNLPSSLKRGAFSILANGLSGLGSHGVPSTRVQHPISLFAPTTQTRRKRKLRRKIVDKLCLTDNTI